MSLCVIGPIAYWILEVARRERCRRWRPGARQDKIVFGDMKAFNLSYWYLVGLCVVFYSAIFPFETFAVTYFVDAKHTSLAAGRMDAEHADLFTMIGTPIDRTVL